MPLFGNKYFQKKLLQRKITAPQASNENQRLENESSFTSSNIALHLGDLVTTFDNGDWVSQSNVNRKKENTSLLMKINQLEEENNLLKLKYEILLDMLVEKSLPHQL